MILGDASPPAQQHKYFLDRFKPGYIFYLYCPFTNPPKPKYLLLVCSHQTPIFFIINLEIHSFYELRPHLKACQVQISCASHTFLNHDSFIDCVNIIREFDQDSVQNQVLGDMTRIKGQIDTQCKIAVMTAVEQSYTIERRYKRIILTALTGS